MDCWLKKSVVNCQDSQCSTPAELSDDAGSVSSTYDVEAVILDFVADSGRSTLSLPGLTPTQRKQAKKIAEQYPNIRCESFGFGSDRTSILFKQDRPNEQATPTATATTSTTTAATGEGGNVGIGDKDKDKDKDKEDKDTQSLSQAAAAAAALPNLSLQLTAVPDEAIPTEGREEEESSNASTCTSGRNRAPAWCRLPSSSWSSTRSSHSPSRLDISLEGADAILPLPKGLQVHNTFICGDEDVMSYDQRSTQSMPHGMFRRSLLKELSEGQLQKSLREEEDTPEEAVFVSSSPAGEIQPESKVQMSFEPGMEVVIDGLLRAPAFNGQHGTVQSFDPEVGRYDILLRSPCPTTGQQWAKVRAENLLLVKFPEPPKHVPTLEVNRVILSADALAGGSPASSAASHMPEASQRSPPSHSQVARPEVMLQEWATWEASKQCYGEQGFSLSSAAASFYPAHMMTSYA
mmetsp:Transcript_27665/g.60108  ORF Transcript_27665/g.60108 Transcript_27665/m.60108 type:complete len:463 (+) Transcript_27665:282-1670(+)|eukprot:CAMPEP_0206423578 /NCGR_PEP_ID=MMETSP0324_2-20121206/2753_1 /ASSEMBLY_ACC=CAM_ASM_000836 /TAXON_ID=2866 /ORGANISM="Crypthecodinium cohnii, Strain Seligo" /LENGTH=462 /DNA_ID=CAMNT_0053888143 /DNA_START=124 /DNA_END=1512 /DNA_ORIENTATION=-